MNTMEHTIKLLLNGIGIGNVVVAYTREFGKVGRKINTAVGMPIWRVQNKGAPISSAQGGKHPKTKRSFCCHKLGKCVLMNE